MKMRPPLAKTLGTICDTPLFVLLVRLQMCLRTASEQAF
jgi:hypothetical protein